MNTAIQTLLHMIQIGNYDFIFGLTERKTALKIMFFQ